MLKAITASTGGAGNPTKPNTDNDNVMLCASVKAVTVTISLRVPLVISNSDNTKSK